VNDDHLFKACKKQRRGVFFSSPVFYQEPPKGFAKKNENSLIFLEDSGEVGLQQLPMMRESWGGVLKHGGRRVKMGREGDTCVFGGR